jgi:TetR/AcrR family transcriptional repressor of nem operon
MARRKEFDPQRVLERAMDLFHHHGYAATSMQDLVEHMEIGRGSLYETFGSKQQLFRAALTRYADQALGDQIQRIERADDPIAGISTMLQELVDHHADDGSHRGCLLVNTIVELAPHEPAIADDLRQRLLGLEQALQRALRRAHDRGEVKGDPAALSRLVLNTMHGLSVRAKYDADRQHLQQIVDLTLCALRAC